MKKPIPQLQAEPWQGFGEREKEEDEGGEEAEEAQGEEGEEDKQQTNLFR